MKKITLYLFFYFLTASIIAQSRLPSNPTPGKCYIRSISPEVYKIYEETYPVYIGGKMPVEALYTISLILEPACSIWEYQNSRENCKSKDSRECMVLQKVNKDEKLVELVIVKNPEKYGNAEEQTFEIKKLISEGGKASWEEIECHLADYNILPIEFEPYNAKLNKKAKRKIYLKLWYLLKNNPNLRVEISVHTDSRGDANVNQELSLERAEAIIDNLVSKGIQRSRLLAKGYGEERLKNDCKDGVECAEWEHAENERVEFRVLAN